jgi:uncharacterized membrane protein
MTRRVYAGAFLAAALHVLLGVGSAAAEAPAYRIDWLGHDFQPFAMNDAGKVVGYNLRDRWNGPALVWEGGRTTEYPKAPGDFVIDAQDVNNAGTIVFGGRVSGEGTAAPVVQSAGGARSRLPVKGWVAGRRSFAINDAGRVVGEDVTADFNSTRAFVWDATTGVTYPDVGAATTRSFANDVNDAGEVVGARFVTSGDTGFLWRDGTTTLLPSPGVSINNRGQVLTEADGIWENGSVTTVPTLPIARVGDYQAGIVSRYGAINDAGQVAGYTEQGYGFFGQEGSWLLHRATVWDRQNGTIDLNGVMGFTPDGERRYPLAMAIDINASGQILGSGPQGGWLLTPVPEPGGVAAVVGCGFAWTLRRPARRRVARTRRVPLPG